MEDRRNSSRRKVFKRGMIITHDQFSTINCLVRNVSEVGARVEVDSAFLLPSRFELLFDGRSCHCEVAWRSQRHLGIRFAEAD
jgi:PilZ domain